MNIRQIALDKLLDHPSQCNVMKKDIYHKLRTHIEQSGHYEPLVVRKHPHQAGYFQIINGRHRRNVLAELGYTRAYCVVWALEDEEAFMMLATLNTLRGHSDTRQRVRLLETLKQRYSVDELLKLIPENRRQLEKYLNLNLAPRIVKPPARDEMPRAITFFVSADQKRIIDKALRGLRQQCRGDDPEERLTRGDLLGIMTNTYLKHLTD
ncbi:MAG: ParB-like nuclease domain-containing protein [Sedimentisphaerales bacterium]|nr:ParB-like nuclease domain-containing protein [Sedimentisphaerales bacterium]